MELRVPYTQQFSPQQTPLKRLLPILRQNSGDAKALRVAVAAAFFKQKADPAKLAGNTLIALRAYGIIDDAGLTDFGKQLVGLQGSEHEAHRVLAKRILVELGGMGIVETLREMKRANLTISLTTLPQQLRQRGFGVSSNSSDLSGLLGWLREANLLQDYMVNEAEYASLVGLQPAVVDAMKGLTSEQIAFLRATVAMNVVDWCPYNLICKHAEELYPGEVRYNWKEIISTVLRPLADAGLIEVRKRTKQDTETPVGRGGKPGDVKPTAKFEKEVAEPVLRALYGSAGFAGVREIRSKSLADIVDEIENGPDQNARGRALEWLAIRLCQMLDLSFMGWRETDVETAEAGRVDAMMHAPRPPYSRWQVQCTVGPITLEAVAEEVGIQKATLADTILIVSTQNATASAYKFRQSMASTGVLSIIFIDSASLKRVVKHHAALHSILRNHAEDAIRLAQTWRPWGLATQASNTAAPRSIVI
jgi:hypothetical protein